MLLVLYWNAIRKNPLTLLFGYGLGETGITAGAHNLYLEIWYYLGVVGLLLYIALFSLLITEPVRKKKVARLREFVVRHISVIVVLITYCSLHGLTQLISYGTFFLVLISVFIAPPGEEISRLDNRRRKTKETGNEGSYFV